MSILHGLLVEVLLARKRISQPQHRNVITRAEMKRARLNICSSPDSLPFVKFKGEPSASPKFTSGQLLSSHRLAVNYFAGLAIFCESPGIPEHIDELALPSTSINQSE